MYFAEEQLRIQVTSLHLHSYLALVDNCYFSPKIIDMWFVCILINQKDHSRSDVEEDSSFGGQSYFWKRDLSSGCQSQFPIALQKMARIKQAVGSKFCRRIVSTLTPLAMPPNIAKT